ncbi:MAG: MOSC domain-containing protein [Gammaproteobacteria bacterium]|nr:MOSC domain-containing protein [Gammaproteobacteria bacterium]
MWVRAVISLRRLRALFSQSRPPQLVGIYVAEHAGAKMQGLQAAEALVGRGLVGDRYANDAGHWRATDRCEITLISAEDLLRSEQRTGLKLQQGAHRRNLVVAGLRQSELRGARLRIGEVELRWHRVRPPCGYLDQIAGRGMAKALGRHAGHCFRVVASGRLQLGDRVERWRSEG